MSFVMRLSVFCKNAYAASLTDKDRKEIEEIVAKVHIEN
jgi:hypothetical protein